MKIERIWTPDPLVDIIKLRAYGEGDMATVTDDGPNPRFEVDVPSVLAAFLAWADGGSGKEDLTLYQKIRSHPSGRYDKPRRYFRNFGVGTGWVPFIDERLETAEERQHWALPPGDAWVPSWTNPDVGNMTWTIEVHLAVPAVRT